ncbi:hypothetical protein Glove_180g96 [Diversispora epigaea]|uniref:Myb-like domain-containing protein n=1 Tax=Diversispora epigaea TaxID=1348612 RepID=A0A397ISV1_9GLOM|nr:hypothetical protein Glove_180g96 [Diversispora epigaea]
MYEENLLRDILIKEIKTEKRTSEINWNDVLSKFKGKGGNRDKKALQERYRNYIHPKVYVLGERKRYLFSKEQIYSIIYQKENNEKIGWKDIADNLNEMIDMENELNKANMENKLPRCTPNQVKNKYNTIMSIIKIEETEEIKEMEKIEEIKEMEKIDKMKIGYIL